MDEWNNTKLSDLERCGEFFRRKHIEHDPTPGTARMARGSGVHAAAREAHVRQLRIREEAIEQGVDEATRKLVVAAAVPSRAEAESIAEDEFNRRIDGGVMVYGEEESAGRVVERARGYARSVGAFYVGRVAPTLEPISVERRVVVRPRRSDGRPLTIHGQMDLIVADGSIDDLKTKEVAPQRSEARDSQQLSLYALLRYAETGKLPPSLVLNVVVQTPKRGDTYHVTQSTHRTLDDVRAVIGRIETAVRAVEAGVFVPAQQGLSWFCSPKWCPFFATCRYVNPRRTE